MVNAGLDEAVVAARRCELQEAGRYLIAQGLTWGNAGNLSARVGPDAYLITASGTRLGELGDDDFVLVSFGGAVEGAPGKKPSKETPMHQAVYEERPEIGAVIHAAPFYSTLLACSRDPVPADLFVEGMYYLERVGRAAYAHPGSAELGEEVRAAAHEANVLLLNNHGVLAYDSSVGEALMATHTLELTCRMVAAARSAGIVLHPLPPDTVRDFLEKSGYRPRREWPDETA
jgi:3-dehydro-4-phosphotetronate decarboxylase